MRKPTGLLEPLSISEAVWNEVSTDFVEGLPVSGGFDVITVIVEQLMKYAHFIPLRLFSAKGVGDSFVRGIVPLHGVPELIFSDRDRVFTSGFWKELFRLQVRDLKQGFLITCKQMVRQN